MPEADDKPQQTHIGFAHFRVKLPSSRPMRILLGSALVLGGMLWFLPVLGIWMLPLGIIVLAIDIAMLRPLRDVLHRWLERLERAAGFEKK